MTGPHIKLDVSVQINLACDACMARALHIPDNCTHMLPPVREHDGPTVSHPPYTQTLATLHRTVPSDHCMCTMCFHHAIIDWDSMLLNGEVRPGWMHGLSVCAVNARHATTEGRAAAYFSMASEADSRMRKTLETQAYLRAAPAMRLSPGVA